MDNKLSDRELALWLRNWDDLTDQAKKAAREQAAARLEQIAERPNYESLLAEMNRHIEAVEAMGCGGISGLADARFQRSKLIDFVTRLQEER